MPTTAKQIKRVMCREALNNIRAYKTTLHPYVEHPVSPEAKAQFGIAVAVLSLAEVAALELLFKQEEGT